MDAVDAILKEHPELMDSLTIRVHDTITLDSIIVRDTILPDIDTAKMDSILFEAFAWESDRPLVAEGTVVDMEAVRRLSAAEARKKIRRIRNQIIQEALKDTTYTYDDSLIHFTFMIKDGKYYFKNTLKERKVSYIKEETTLKPDIVKQPAWKNTWFWILVFIIIVLLSLLRYKR